MKKWIGAVSAALALTLAAGCGSAGDAGNSRHASEVANNTATRENGGESANVDNGEASGAANESANVDGDGTSGTANESANDGGGAAEAPDPDNAGTNEDGAGAEEPSPAAVKPLYRMDKAYNIRPIEEGTPKKVVLLTFDDGPKEEPMLTRMLDTLDMHNAKAIFFVNGYRVKENPELIKLLRERGQTIGNHSWDHINLKNEPEVSQRKQVGDVNAIIEELTGEKPKFFRPPFGAGNDALKAFVKEEGMLYMTWSNGSLDWDLKATAKNPELVIKNVLEQAHDGANILMHELPWTADALDSLLTKLASEGYGFVDPATIDVTGNAASAK